MTRPDSTVYKNPSWLKGITLLIAEDNPTNYKLLYAMLKSSGAKICWAQDGEQTITFIRNKPADEKCIVLMDLKMPLIDGYEAKSQIKLIDNEIPVIAVTAYAHFNDREKILRDNFDGYIPKPIDLGLLVKELSQYSLQKEDTYCYFQEV